MMPEEPEVGTQLESDPPKIKRIKLLERMKANPNGDWQIKDIEKVCNKVGMECVSPSHGSHFKTYSENLVGALTIPAKRPIKAVYIKKFVAQVAAHEAAQVGETDQ